MNPLSADETLNKILLDSNILVYLTDEAHPFYPLVAGFFNHANRKNTRFYIAYNSTLEFYANAFKDKTPRQTQRLDRPPGPRLHLIGRWPGMRQTVEEAPP